MEQYRKYIQFQLETLIVAAKQKVFFYFLFSIAFNWFRLSKIQTIPFLEDDDSTSQSPKGISVSYKHMIF